MSENYLIVKKESAQTLADSIKEKAGVSGGLYFDELKGVVDGISTGDGVALPELTNEANNDELFLNKELINSSGEVVKGTFTIDDELADQDNLLAQIETALENAASGGGDPVLQTKTVTPSTAQQIVTPDSGYDGLESVTVNAMPTATQATPAISINTANGLITATATQTAGYVAAGTKSATKQLTFQAAKTVTPGTADQTAVAANTYVGGAVTVKGDANLVEGNIRNGITLFGKTGTYTGTSYPSAEEATF